MLSRAAMISGILSSAVVLGCVDRTLVDASEGTGPTAGDSGGGGGETGTTTSGGVDPGTPTGDGATGSSAGGSTSSDLSGGGVTGETGVMFIPDPDGGGALACDPWLQDCPEGEKCAAWAADGGNSWNATKCVPVIGDGQPGEPCSTVGGGVSGNDDCAKGAMCWEVSAENVGVCVALCTGSWNDPTCAGKFDCWHLNSEGSVNICLPACDALLQDCPGGDLCLPIDDTFVCVLDASGDEGQAFDPCEFANACDPGLVCAGSASASECDPMATGCCVPMCSISGMMVCPGVGQECTSLYDEGMAPPKHADIGYCTLPV